MRKLGLAAAGILVAVALALVLTGCGSSGNSSASGGAAPPAQADPQARVKFQECMQQHGVAPPSGPPQPGQRPNLDAKTRSAFQACREYLPAHPGGLNG